MSVFDVLYQAYSDSLGRYSRVKYSDPERSVAESVAEQCLRDMLAELRYARFGYQAQVFLRDVLPNTRRLNEEQRSFVFRDSALDFGVYSRVTKRLLLAIEVDGWEFHGMSEEQQRRDALKDSIMSDYGVPVLRLPTIGSGEGEQIREALDRLL